jgi:hypothetical protein
VFEQDALRTAIAFAEGMNHVEVAEQFCAGVDQVGPVKVLKPVCIGEHFEQFVGFGLDAAGDAEVRVVLGDVDGTQLSGPIVEVGKEPAMDRLQVGQAVGRRGEVDGLEEREKLL